MAARDGNKIKPLMNTTTKIWNDFHQELQGFALKRLGHLQDAEDVLQEVFLKVFNNLDKVHRADNIQQYLYAMVRNAINDHFRREDRNKSALQNQTDFSEEEWEEMSQTLFECCINPFMQQLPEKDREALVLTEMEGVSQKELAKRWGISYSGAKSRVQRARERLKAVVMDCCEFQVDAYGNVLNNPCDTCS